MSPYRPALRSFVHALAAVLAWCLFAYWWRQVASMVDARDAGTAIALIALTLAATLTIDIVWVRYNLSLHRRKPARRNLPPVSEEATVDALGRRIVHPGLLALREARQVVVSVQGGMKRLEPAPDGLPQPAGASAPAGADGPVEPAGGR